MDNKSLFPELVDIYFQPVVVDYYTRKEEQGYHFLADLTPEYSIDGSWASITNEARNIKADIIPLDSSIPLKSANPIRTAAGEVPKVATRRQLNESKLTAFNQLLQLKGPESDVVIDRLFEHTRDVINGQMEEYERMYLQGLSTGYMTAGEDVNVGQATRVDFGYLADNKLNASVVWGTTNDDPLADIEAVLEAARVKGVALGIAKMDRATFNKLRNSDVMKAFFDPNATNPRALNFDQLNSVMQSEYGMSIQIIEKTIKAEQNGVITNITPWAAGQIIFAPSNQQIGKFVWTELAEMSFPVGDTTYQRTGPESSILVKKYRDNTPALSEQTASESRALPVISNVNEIFKLDTTAVA